MKNNRTPIQKEFDWTFPVREHSFEIDLLPTSTRAVPKGSMCHKINLVKGGATMEIAFNLPHVKHQPRFVSLAGDIEVNYRDINIIGAAIIDIMRYNPDFSKWQYNKQNSVNLHVPEDSHLETLLDQEIIEQKKRWFQWKVSRSNYKATDQIVEHIKTIEDLGYAFLSIPYDYRQMFVWEAKEKITKLKERNERTKALSTLKAKVEKGIKNLKDQGGINVGTVTKALNRVARVNPILNHLPSPDQIGDWLDQLRNHPYYEEKIPRRIFSVARISKMPTRLSKYADYPTTIISYKLTEPFP